MLFLEAANIKKYYSDRLILAFDRLKVYSGDRIGIVGQNGSGKTTLLNILSGEIEPDEGFVRRYSGISFIRQFAEENTEKADGQLLKEFNLANKVHQEVFSGGESTRIKLANSLGNKGALLLADEPTANLDCKGVELLKQKLSTFDTFLLISHDRSLLDELCNRILEIKDGSVKLYDGNYTFYKEQSSREFERKEQDYENYVSQRASLENAIRDRQSRSKSMRKAPKRMGNSEARLHRRAANEKQEKLHDAANSLKTRLEKLEVKEKPRELPKIKLDFSMTNPPENKIVISAEKLSFSYGTNRIFDHTGFKVYNGSKTALWGENGTGKTTLLNLISGRQCGDINIVPKARIGYFRQGFENLDYNRPVLENVMKDSVQSQTVARTILARLLISGDDVNKNVGVLSGGERIKVSFAKLFVSNANILLLDEPTNYLDMLSLEALENVLCEYEGTVLFVSHDRAFVNSVADRLLVCQNKTITGFEGTLREYELNREKKQMPVTDEMERIALQMKLTEVVAKLSKADKDRDILEEEYQRLLLQLKKQPGDTRR